METLKGSKLHTLTHISTLTGGEGEIPERGSNTKLLLVFNKNKVVYKDVFIIFIWFYCKYYVGLGVIGYLYIYKFLFIFRNGVLSTRQWVGTAYTIRVAREALKKNRASFNAPRHPRHNGKTQVNVVQTCLSNPNKYGSGMFAKFKMSGLGWR